jgi:hypothetical protein
MTFNLVCDGIALDDTELRRGARRHCRFDKEFFPIDGDYAFL